MDVARDHLLSRAGLALDQHGRFGGCDGFGQAQHIEPASRVADGTGARGSFAAFDLLAERPVLDTQLAVLRRAFEDGEELVVVKRLLDVIEGALVHRLHGALQRGLRRHQNDGRVGVLLPRGGKDLDAADVGHADIREHDVRLDRTEALESLTATTSRVRVEARIAQQDAERFENARLVVDHENGRRAIVAHVYAGESGAPAESSAPVCTWQGSTMVNRVPEVELSRYTRPRCASMARCTTASPSPLPPGFVVKNGSKSRSRFSGATPGPSSLTLMATAPSRSVALLPTCSGDGIETSRCTRPPGGDAWMAFKSKLNNARCRRSSSPSMVSWPTSMRVSISIPSVRAGCASARRTVSFTSVARSTGSRRATRTRAKSRNSDSRRLSRSDSRMTSRASVCSSDPVMGERASCSTALRMDASGFLIS